MQEARLPALTDFQLVEEDEAPSGFQSTRLSYTEKGMRNANQPTLPKSFNTIRIPRFQPKSIKIATTTTPSVGPAFAGSGEIQL